VKYVKELFVIAFISAVVGGLVSLPAVFFLKSTWLEPFKGAGVGALIGLAARLAFQFFYHNLNGNKALGFMAIAAVIGAGTFTGAFALGIREALHFALFILLAEITGMTMAAVGWRRYRRMNDRLKAIQAGYEDQTGN
jgi:hypothetical protein